MTKVAIIGDVHGDWHALDIVLAHAIKKHQVDAVIQVGDFGYSWPGQKHWHPKRKKYSNREKTLKGFPDDLPMYWVDGNHENFDILFDDYGNSQPRWHYIERGTSFNIPEIGTLLGIGGANSIDIESRTPGYDWWPDEAPGYNDQHRAISTIDKCGTIKAVISHEHPERFEYYDSKLNTYTKRIGAPTRLLLDNIFTEVKPEFWFFGHHHKYKCGETDGCKWHCAPIITSLAYLIWDGSTVEYVSAIAWDKI